MRVRTEPTLPNVEQKLSVKDIDQDLYKEAIKEIRDEGYEPRSILLKRQHRFSQEEYDLFMPDASYEEFVEARGGNPSAPAEEQQTVPPFEELFPEDSRDGEEEI